MARQLHDIQQAPERALAPPTIHHVAFWTAERATYGLSATASYYKAGTYQTVDLTLKISIYEAREDGEVRVLAIDVNNPREALTFLRVHTKGSLWETLDAIGIDYEEIRAQAVTWFAERCNYEFPR